MQCYALIGIITGAHNSKASKQLVTRVELLGPTCSSTVGSNYIRPNLPSALYFVVILTKCGLGELSWPLKYWPISSDPDTDVTKCETKLYSKY
jgi:hypothetical protein